MHFLSNPLGVAICLSLCLWMGPATALRKRVDRASVMGYFEFQRRYLEEIGPLIDIIRDDGMNEFRVGWDDEVEEEYLRERARRAAAAAGREEQRRLREQQVDQQDPDEDEPREMRFEVLMEQDELDDDEEDEGAADPPSPSLTALLESLQPVLDNLIRSISRVNYNVVPYLTEAQRQEAGMPFNGRLLNEDMRITTINALTRLKDLTAEGTDGWEIEMNEHFALDTDEYHERINGEVQPHGLLNMIEAFMLEVNQSWVFGHDLRTIYAYIYAITDYRARRGRERPNDADYVLIDWNGAADFANNLQILSGGVGSYMARFKADLKAAFKFLPRDRAGPFVPQALYIAGEIIDIFEFYHRLLTMFYRNVRAMADRPYGQTAEQNHFRMVRGRIREQAMEQVMERLREDERQRTGQANVLRELNEINQQNQADVLDRFNQINEGNPLNQGDFAEQLEQLGQIARDQQWDDA
ncbi:hypothetical protein TWF718_010153 [Orbilia javanica]|uniref:Uncharacterized protein n=1 Tax=Orbilia javanica TaxID=47235 RepID=A0AAN8RDR3_9PEZI